MFKRIFRKELNTKLTVNEDLKRAGLKQLLGIRLTKITASYFGIMALGIGIFYLAKKDVDSNRHNLMKIKQELNQNALDTVKYPSRFDLIKAEKEKGTDLTSLLFEFKY